MSMFNTDLICPACKEDERHAPGYDAAARAERRAVRAGNYNFPGVGLSEEDRQHLRRRNSR